MQEGGEGTAPGRFLTTSAPQHSSRPGTPGTPRPQCQPRAHRGVPGVLSTPPSACSTTLPPRLSFRESQSRRAAEAPPSHPVTNPFPWPLPGAVGRGGGTVLSSPRWGQPLGHGAGVRQRIWGAPRQNVKGEGLIVGVLVFWERSQSVSGFIPAAKNLAGEGKKSLLAPSLGRKGNLELHHLRNPGGDAGRAPCPYTPPPKTPDPTGDGRGHPPEPALWVLWGFRHPRVGAGPLLELPPWCL